MDHVRGVHYGVRNENVILCERGIRTFETYTRNTLDLQSIPVLRKKTHLRSLWIRVTQEENGGLSNLWQKQLLQPEQTG